MKYLGFLFILFMALVLFFGACQKWTDPPPKTDPRLDSPYCNDPAAVNYNWGFPGRPDDSVCYYPADMYKGTYVFKDSIYLSNNVFSYTYNNADTFLYMYSLSKNKMGVVGFCPNGDTLYFTVDRGLHATVDTGLNLGIGQMFCSIADTASGTIALDITDSSNRRYIVNIIVASDTGTNFHRGFAIKQ